MLKKGVPKKRTQNVVFRTQNVVLTYSKCRFSYSKCRFKLCKLLIINVLWGSKTRRKQDLKTRKNNNRCSVLFFKNSFFNIKKYIIHTPQYSKFLRHTNFKNKPRRKKYYIYNKNSKNNIFRPLSIQSF